jgi:hypothetical protein
VNESTWTVLDESAPSEPYNEPARDRGGVVQIVGCDMRGFQEALARIPAIGEKEAKDMVRGLRREQMDDLLVATPLPAPERVVAPVPGGPNRRERRKLERELERARALHRNAGNLVELLERSLGYRP